MDAFKREEIPSNPEILLIKLRSIGDVVYNTSVYSPLKRLFPGSRLTVLVEPPSLGLVKDHPDVDEALCFRKGSLMEQFRFYFDLFRERYDVVIDMHEGTRGAVMCFLTFSRFRIGNKFAQRSFLYNVKLDFSDLEPRFPIDYQIALIKKMGAHFDSEKPAIYFSQASEKKAEAILRENGIFAGDRYCVIHPGTRKIYNQWQYDKFARLAEKFYSEFDLKVVLTCGPGEEEQANSVMNKITGLRVPFVLTELQELGVITRGAKFALCHNGGYMHVSSVLGTPVIALFGSVHPRVWRPLGTRDEILYKKLECSPCNHKTRKEECYGGDAECKRIISVEDALAAADRILSREKRPKN